ncbi:transcription termination factor 1, mitochondrial [Lampris incognitus]|uniref:transcription termination factor 1, mitochondrial n=1 Tax=Lampris incognitus TaxID=2546036 RepID=UPI0024B5B381|nr:transcription termination factor 1, mitochondrial [Lampris incognitus]XP_056154797.1 transcription termination factor 1, mitochondrial [Lampris incognitus]
MAAVPVVRTLFSLRQSLPLKCSPCLRLVQVTCYCRPRGISLRGFCTVTPKINEPNKSVPGTENKSLLESLCLMGVDVKMARQRQPGVLRKTLTNERGVGQFLQSKGASPKVIASIISRFPRSITRSVNHLEQRWELWRNIFESDEEIVSILDRSPESFFRSSDNENLEQNIFFLISIGIDKKSIHRLVTRAPRTFSNSVELNKQMVWFLQDVCAKLGGENPEQFAKTIVTKNVYILIRSIKRVQKNIDFLKYLLKLSDSELSSFLQGPGADILDLSNEYLKNNFKNLEQKMALFGCCKADIRKLIVTYPIVLYIGSVTLNAKLDCLLNGGITIKQIVEKPKILDYSTRNITGRLQELERVGYDFKKNGINILNTSQKRFDANMGKLVSVVH